MNDAILENDKTITNTELIKKDNDNLILSHRAKYLSFKHRTKVEFLKFFIV